MRLFLDTSVVLAACGSDTGASTEVFDRHDAEDWSLCINPYVLDEIERNLGRVGARAEHRWRRRRLSLEFVPDVLTLDRPTIFSPAKDRPILFSALAWADVLLTLDRGDFDQLLGSTFYGLGVLKPSDFLWRAQTTT